MSLVEEQVQAGASAASSSLLDEIMAQARITPVDEGYSVAKQGVAALIANILDSGATSDPVNKALVDSMIVELDKKLSKQMDVILHAKELQEMVPPRKSCWRISSFHPKSLSPASTNMFIPAVMVSLVANRWGL